MVYKNIDFTKVEEKGFTDLPDLTPFVELPLQEVGITNRPHYIKIKDPFTGEIRELLADIKMLLDLKINQKGLHISRMERVLHELNEYENLTLKEYAKELTKRLINEQSEGSVSAKVIINIRYEREVNKNIERPSNELYTLHCTHKENIKTNKNTTKIGLTVPVINSCPCTQRWGIKKFYYYLKEKGFDDEQISEIVENAPLQAHTNRGEATLIVSDENASIKKIYEILEKSSPIIRELLTGKDEHKFVRKTHEKGFYCEDVTREIAKNTLKHYRNKLEPQTKIEITSEIDESIHYHNLYAKINTTLEELAQNIQN